MHISSVCRLIWAIFLTLLLSVPSLLADTAHRSARTAGPNADSLISIPELHQNIATLNGQVVTVLGMYVNPGDSKLVTTYAGYMLTQLMPAGNIIFITGLAPNSPYWDGGTVAVTGTVSTTVNPYPIYGNDTLLITINATAYDYFILPTLSSIKIEPIDWSTPAVSRDGAELLACDPCKFAILISGGGDANNNKPGFWKDIQNLYAYKTDPAGGNYCPENVKILYYLGDSGDSTVIPNSAVDPCTQANVAAAHEEISRRIAACGRDSMDATVQKMISNHGEDNAGAVTLGAERISPEELKNMQQPLIDSCCDFMFDEFTECYGGDMAEGIKGLDDKAKTEIHGNSAAGAGSVAVGDPKNGSPYLIEKIRRLRLGEDYETAVRGAKTRYKTYVDSLRQKIQDAINEVQGILDTLPPADPDRDEWQDLRDKLQAVLDLLNAASAEGSVSWVRFPFKAYCEWKKVVVPPGGQLKLKFKGKGGCGNVSVYKENPDGSRTKVKVWNWNLPGSFGFIAGNDLRVINADLTGTGIFWIHNDNGEFQVTIDALKDQSLPESASNISTFSGFSLGGTDNSPFEFSVITGTSLTIPNIELTPLNLVTVPAIIGPCGGVGQLTVTFTAQANQWWQNMELHVVPYQVIQPGMLQVQCPSAQIPITQIPLSPGAQPFTVHLGAIPPGPTQLTLLSQGGLCIAMDSWGLRSLVPTFPVYVCGDANGSGAVSISDVVFLINYIFAGGAAPNPLAAGDANCSGAISISDAVYLINFIFGGGPMPCSSCK